MDCSAHSVLPQLSSQTKSTQTSAESMLMTYSAVQGTCTKMVATAPTEPQQQQDQTLDPKVPEKATDEEMKELEAAEAAPDKRTLYIKRCGYGSMGFFDGKDAKGKEVYFIEVARKLVGWDITVKRGGKSGPPILHLQKAVRFLSLIGWDRGSKMQIKVRPKLPHYQIKSDKLA